MLKTIIFSFLLVAHGATAQTYPEMITVEGGTFTMGDTEMEGGADEQPAREVTLKTFQMSKTPVTVAQYRAYCIATGKSMPEIPSWGWIDNHPMVNVTWHDAVAYTDWLADKTGENYRLPTEAEWEYAARGGESYTYSGSNNLSEVGWCSDNSGGQTQPVGLKKPNGFGLYDMSGNVWEWCSSDYFANNPKDTPKGSASGSYRVVRGGSWYNVASYCRVADRNYSDPISSWSSGGFRVVLSQ